MRRDIPQLGQKRWRREIMNESSEFALLVGLNLHIRSRICMTRQNPTKFHLFVIKEATIRLVHTPLENLPDARRAGPGTARIRQVDPFLLGLVENVHVVWALEFLGAIRREQLDLVCGHCGNPAAARLEPEEGLAHAGVRPKAHRGPRAKEGCGEHGAREGGHGNSHWRIFG